MRKFYLPYIGSGFSITNEPSLKAIGVKILWALRFDVILHYNKGAHFQSGVGFFHFEVGTLLTVWEKLP